MLAKKGNKLAHCGMASGVAREVADNIIEGGCGENRMDPLPSNTFSKDFPNVEKDSSSSAYTLAEDRSQFSREIDRWLGINGTSTGSTENAAVQRSRIPVVQRSTLARSSSLNGGFWYMLAMVLPLFSVHRCPHVQCTTSMFIKSVKMMVGLTSRACGRLRQHFRTLASDQVVRELFATAMDIVLVIYALGFLVLSMYQASIFG